MNSLREPQAPPVPERAIENGIALDPSILDSIDAGLIVLDHGARIVRWNAWMASASGISATIVEGKSLGDVFPETEAGRLASAIDAALTSGASSLLTHALHPAIFPLKTRAGRELLHDVTVSSVRGGVGPQCLLHIADVTMAVRRERFLRDRQNARYDAVVESAPDVIVTFDSNAVIRSANVAATLHLGYGAKELIGEKATILFRSDAAWAQAWKSLMSGETIRKAIEVVARRKDGSPTYFETSASRWSNDSRIFVTAILRDVSERREAEEALRSSEEQARAAAIALADLNATLERRVLDRTAELMTAEEALRQSQKMEAIGQLTGGIAHDFNNLLQGIVGALHLVQKRIGEGRIGDVDRFLQGALTSANRASTLTHRLLAFSRQQPVDPRPLDVNHLIGTIEELLNRAIGEKIRMQFESATDLWLVRCDVNQLENALLNLAINARDAMLDGGTLTIGTSNVTLDGQQALVFDVTPGEYVRVAIGDTGTGMPAEVQARAFDPFFTTKPIGQGTGLGLSMIYGFVRQSEGSVRIDSEVGKGTTIEIVLPRFRGDLIPDEQDGAGQGGTSRAGSEEVVLVVEDEDVVRLLVVEVLNDLGYRALEAVDGASASRILQSSQRIDLLATDIGLPDMNGRQVADAARAKRPNLKVLFMTGYAEKAASNSFLQSGMEIISKPFSMDHLASKIREMIER
jgi:PAS domain S-box-containing protein